VLIGEPNFLSCEIDEGMSGDAFGGLGLLIQDVFSGISSQGAAIVQVEPFEECGG